MLDLLDFTSNLSNVLKELKKTMKKKTLKGNNIRKDTNYHKEANRTSGAKKYNN